MPITIPACNSNLPYGYKELYGSGEEYFDFLVGGWKATRVFFGPWENRLDFLDAIFYTVTQGSNAAIYVPGAVYPEIANLIPTNAKIQGKLDHSNEGALGQISYAAARIEIEYNSVIITTPGGENPGGEPTDPETIPRFAQVSISGGIETLVVPGEELVDEDNNPLIDVRAVRQIPFGTIKVTFFHVINPIFGYLEYYPGLVNSGPFTLPNGLTYGAATLLYDGYEAEKTFLLNQTTTWQVSLTFLSRPEQFTWNQVFNNKGNRVTAKFRGTNNNIYDSVNFGILYSSINGAIAGA